MHGTLTDGTKEGHTQLLNLKIMKGLKKGELTYKATIICSGEDNVSKESLPPIIENVHEQNKDMMADKSPKSLPRRWQVYYKIE